MIFLGNAKNYRLVIIILVLKVFDILLLIFCHNRSQLAQRIPDRQERPPLWVEDENEHNKAGVHSETGRGDQSHALQHWGRHMTERLRQQDFISRESVSTLLSRRVENVFFRLSKLMCTLKILMKYLFFYIRILQIS